MISCRTFQAARRDLALEAALGKLDLFDLIILDDIGYAQEDQAEASREGFVGGPGRIEDLSTSRFAV